MKQSMQFRFFPETMVLITQMAKAMHLNNTRIVELEIKEFSQHNMPNKNLLKYSGTLSEDDAEDMLKVIKKSKKNKSKVPVL